MTHPASGLTLSAMELEVCERDAGKGVDPVTS
jgi:hypothetical protein